MRRDLLLRLWCNWLTERDLCLPDDMEVSAIESLEHDLMTMWESALFSNEDKDMDMGLGIAWSDFEVTLYLVLRESFMADGGIVDEIGPAVRELAVSYGFDSMVDAYLSGVPLDDIVMG